MALVYTGPFSSAEIPAAQQIVGWSNNASTVAATVFNRYRDGDPQSSFVWREIAGNLNYQLALSRRLICSLRFNEPTSADPVKCNIGNDWDSRDSLYTIIGPIELLPNVRRGVDQPPLLSVRVRARMDAGVATGKVRVYACGRQHDVRAGWPFTADHGAGFVNFDIASATYPASPGFSAAATLTIPTDPPNMYCSWLRWQHPAVSTLQDQDVDALVTYLAVAGIGDDTNGPLIAALEIWEEAPAA